MDDVSVAIEAARAGSEVVRSRVGSDLHRTDKGGGDLVTDADLDAEAAIIEVIRTHRPHDAIEGEESGGHAGTSGRSWLVDPLCGTLNFAAGGGPVAVNVALRADGVALAAAVGDPLTDDLFWVDGGRSGAWRAGQPRPLEPSPASRLVDVDLDAPVGPPPPWTLGVLGDPGFWSAFRGRVVSSSIALAWVAAGLRTGYLTDGAVADSVHFAAGIALCRGTGCAVTDLTGDAIGTGPGLVAAADAATSRALLELVARHRT